MERTNFAVASAYSKTEVLQVAVFALVLLGGYLYVRQREGLAAVLGAWRMSVLAGLMGAAASAGWFTAFAMRNAADVRALGLIEVLFSYAIARRMFGERISVLEGMGMALLIAGLVVLCLQL